MFCSMNVCQRESHRLGQRAQLIQGRWGGEGERPKRGLARLPSLCGFDQASSSILSQSVSVVVKGHFNSIRLLLFCQSEVQNEEEK